MSTWTQGCVVVDLGEVLAQRVSFGTPSCVDRAPKLGHPREELGAAS